MLLRTALSAAFALAFSACAYAQSSPTPSLQQILYKVGEIYGSLLSVQVENRIIVEETERGAAPSRIADVTIVAASKGPVIQGRSLPSSKFAVDITAAQVRILHGFDGQSAWFYSSKTQEYAKGPTPHSVVGSVLGSAVLSVAFASLKTIDPQLWTSMRLAGSEVVQIDGEKRDCYVLEGTIKPHVLPIPPNGGTYASVKENLTNAKLGMARPSTYSSLLALQGMTSGPSFVYSTPQDTVPAQIRLWVDKERYLVLRRTIDERTQRMPAAAKSPPKDATPVDLRLTDTFTRVRIGNDFPSTIFHFEPPSGAKEGKR